MTCAGVGVGSHGFESLKFEFICVFQIHQKLDDEMATIMVCEFHEGALNLPPEIST